MIEIRNATNGPVSLDLQVQGGGSKRVDLVEKGRLYQGTEIVRGIRNAGNGALLLGFMLADRTPGAKDLEPGDHYKAALPIVGGIVTKRG